MKARFCIRRHHLPTLAALVGVILGIFVFSKVPDGILGAALPIPTLRTGEKFEIICAVFGKEALPLAFAIIASGIMRHPLPLLLDTAWRGFACTLSSLYLYRNTAFLVFLLYLALHLTALLTHIAASVAALQYRKATGVFPILYFIGLLFLITVIRLLAFSLIL